MTGPNYCDAVLRYLRMWTLPSTKATISAVIGCAPREVEEAVHDLRHQMRGTPETIVAGADGYLYTDKPEVARRCLAEMRHRVGEMHGTIDDIESSVACMERKGTVDPGGQARIPFPGDAHA